MRFWYLSTPYAKYHLGREAAFLEACRNAALLLTSGVTVYCPIAHGHPLQTQNLIPNNTWGFWSCIDEDMLRSSAGVIVCEMEGWQHSVGVAAEIKWAEQAALPVLYMKPGVVDEELLKNLQTRHQLNS